MPVDSVNNNNNLNNKSPSSIIKKSSQLSGSSRNQFKNIIGDNDEYDFWSVGYVW